MSVTSGLVERVAADCGDLELLAGHGDSAEAVYRTRSKPPRAADCLPARRQPATLIGMSTVMKRQDVMGLRAQ